MAAATMAVDGASLRYDDVAAQSGRAGHLVNMERPTAVNSLLLRFLRAHSA